MAEEDPTLYVSEKTGRGPLSEDWVQVYSQECVVSFLFLFALSRKMENISRGLAFGDFVTIPTEGSMQDNTVARLQSTRVQTPLSSLF